MNSRIKHIIWMVVVIGILFSGCSEIQFNQREKAGVPDSQVICSDAFINFQEDNPYPEYQIEHNVDTETHTDYVMLSINSQGDYLRLSCVYYLTYQYYKSDDMWVLTDCSNGSYQKQLNVETFTRESGWSGHHENTDFIGYFQNEFDYTVFILNIDQENETITIRYEIDFTNEIYDDLVETTPVTLKLRDFSSTEFLVNIKEEGKSIPWENGIKFVLDEDGFEESNNR